MAKALSTDSLNELIECLAKVEDPRVQGRCLHLLIDNMAISVLAILCGAEGIKDIHSFALAKEQWLKKFLKLPCGISSEDTIARILLLIEPSHVDLALTECVARQMGHLLVWKIFL